MRPGRLPSTGDSSVAGGLLAGAGALLMAGSWGAKHYTRRKGR